MKKHTHKITLSTLEKRWRRALEFREKRKRRNRRRLGRRKRVGNFETRQHYEDIYAPEDFRFIDNHDEIIELLKRLKHHAKKQKPVFLRMDNVTRITSGTAALLLSVMDEFVDSQTPFKGNNPKDVDARDVLERSGFFRYVNGQVKNADNLYCDDVIERKVEYKVDAELSAKLIHNAMKTVTGEAQKNARIQSILIEMMANTVNHAYPSSKLSPWWISVSHESRDALVKFSFIDKGVGIANTLKLRWEDRIKDLFSSNLDLVKSAFTGKFGSRTGLPYRGKGLPKIKSVAESGIFSKFIVISNDVIYDFVGNNSKIMKNSLDGTFYYFEMRGSRREDT